MKNILIALLLIGSAGLAVAQANGTPVGLWKTIDDKTGKDTSLVRITDNGGLLTGRIEKLIDPSTPNPKCTECVDERKDMPINGMVIIRGVHQGKGDKDIWNEGDILDPASGKVYDTRLKPVDGGKKLEVRGYITLFYRTQTWVRVE